MKALDAALCLVLGIGTQCQESGHIGCEFALVVVSVDNQCKSTPINFTSSQASAELAGAPERGVY